MFIVTREDQSAGDLRVHGPFATFVEARNYLADCIEFYGQDEAISSMHIKPVIVGMTETLQFNKIMVDRFYDEALKHLAEFDQDMYLTLKMFGFSGFTAAWLSEEIYRRKALFEANAHTAVA